MTSGASNDGPYYDQFSKGMAIPTLPPVTVTEADNVAYRMITGDQHLPSADRSLASAVTGADAGMIYPALVMQYSIGQTTNATRRAIANLYYRSVRILRSVRVGETLRTSATVLGLADSKSRGDQHRGKVWLGIETVGDDGPVARYERCALVASRVEPPGHADEIPGPSDPAPLAELAALVPQWDLSRLPRTDWPVGEERADAMRDHVDLAPSLARMTFNQAFVHRDGTASIYGKRLVYGGHVQGLAQSSLSRVLPGIATAVAWDGCDHVGPAFEGDLLAFRHKLVEESAAGSGRLMRFEVRAAAVDAEGNAGDDILVWTPIVFAP
ncbi:MAG: MaoC/PaaZ C-terminal domain-containing protein [Acidimicrobiia bacterium]|nr:MaoC/PaaZ C-terminal domain-containing protein [Acidimicrobiia bacterium]